MKLVQRTSNTLTMRYVPWGTWLALGYLLAKFLLIVSFLTIQGFPQKDPAIITLCVILLVVLAGLLIYAIAVEGCIRTLRLNKITGKLTLQERAVWRTKLIEHPLKKIADVAVIRTVFGKPHRVVIILSQDKPKKQDFSNMSLLSKLMFLRGSLLYLHPMFGLSLRWSECKRCAKEIRDFLDLPPQSE